MRAIRLLALAAALAAAGCGYQDDNSRAAAIVAQAYLDAVVAEDAAGVCRVVAPEVQAAFAAGQPSCEAGLQPVLDRSAPVPRLEIGIVAKLPNPPPGNPRFTVTVRSQPGRMITVGRYGSIWRVVDGGTAG
jgi:hypothetical protein